MGKHNRYTNNTARLGLGVQSNNTINTTMKTILLICAFAALAAAHPSEDVETDLLTPSTVVPETTFLEGKQTTKGLPQCADIHAETLCTKKSCNSQKGRSTSCLCIPGSQEASGKNKK